MNQYDGMEFLYHYYEKSAGPFRNLSELPLEQASAVQEDLKKAGGIFAAHRYDGYLERRRELEQLARGLFAEKGGKPVRKVPHYMVVGECRWLQSWYREGESVRLHISEFDPLTLSFTYGDMFPTFSPRVTDGKEYRGKVYMLGEITGLIRKYGLPQTWNEDGRYGPERYIEVQVWSDEPLRRFYRG